MSLIQDYQASFRERNAYLSQEFTSGPVDWADAPHKHTVRPGVFEVPLPNGRLLAGHLADTGARPGLTLAALAQALWYANGLLRRKVDVDWAKSAAAQNRDGPSYARGTSSGGGLYPTELYLVAEDLPGLPNGIYHHCEARSTLQRTRAGRHARALCASWRGVTRHGVCHLVLTTRFWKNVFKYKNFGYQLMTEDCGAVVGTLLQALDDVGIAATVRFNFADRGVADIMGLDQDAEAAMIVIELGDGPVRLDPPHAASSAPAAARPPAPLERSRRVAVPALIGELHRATLLDDVALPVPLPAWDGADAGAAWDALPPAAPIAGTTRLFMQRRSSMGRQQGEDPLTRPELATLLAAAAAPYRCDLDAAAAPPRSVRLAAYARHVDALAPGAYAYGAARHALVQCAGPDTSDIDVQRIYYMQNYNINQTGVLLAIVARHGAAHAAWGDRSIRICNGEAGMAAQRIYLAAAQLGLSCGAVLGFNCAEADGLFGLDRPAESIVLMMLIARRPVLQAAFDSRFDG